MSNQENNKYNMNDLINFALEKDVVGFEDAFNNLMLDYIEDEIERKTEEVRQNFLMPQPSEEETEE